MGADPAALAGVFTDGINAVHPGDGIKAAMGLAEAAASAFFCVQDSLISAEKIRDLRSSGNLRYQVEVGGVHITVGHSPRPGKADEAAAVVVFPVPPFPLKIKRRFIKLPPIV